MFLLITKPKIRFVEKNDQQASVNGIKKRSTFYNAFVWYSLNVVQGSEGFVTVFVVYDDI